MFVNPYFFVAFCGAFVAKRRPFLAILLVLLLSIICGHNQMKKNIKKY